ncbi:hypothetical protein ACQHGV_12350 [Sphingomonas pseudosanguinis]|uniref:hypothetical protein n=1 Tax=Sphingomonas pseudosanguinis TaxID=413712 RepID=UPI003F86FCD6
MAGYIGGMSALLFILALPAAQSALPVSLDWITIEVAAERVAACHVGQVTIRPLSKSDDAALIIDATDISDRQSDCVHKAASFHKVVLPSAVQSRYDARRIERLRAWWAADGRQTLKEMGLLERLPPYVPGKTDDAAFAQQVEVLCQAKGALHPRATAKAVNPAWFDRLTYSEIMQGRAKCVIAAILASGFRSAKVNREQAVPE